MAKGWYVLHTYSGHENKVEKYLQIYMQDGSLTDYLSDVKVPCENVVVETKDGKKKQVSKKFLPGYILLELDLPEHNWKVVVNKIHRIQGVMGFLGQSSQSKPKPISSEEAKKILQKTGEIKMEKRLIEKQEFKAGEEIKIVDGPFEGFNGTIEEVNLEKGKLRVTVGIFGRSTPVELDFSQVERIK